MKAVPRGKLRKCRYQCADSRGWLLFLALTLPVIILAMSWIDGTGLKKLPVSLTVAGIGFLAALVIFIIFSLRRAEYAYFEALAQAAAELDAETPDVIVAELEENRGARLKNYLLRDPEKLFLVGKILIFSACNRAVGQRMIDTALECAPELAEFKELSWKEAARRYTNLAH